MQAASRESLAMARERLSSLTDGASADTVNRLAADLRAVAGLLGVEPSLRRAIADSARTAEARKKLVSRLLSTRISAPALEIITQLASGRWSTATDLVNSVELLSVDAELTLADSNGVLGEVEDELFRFNRVIVGNPTLATVLADTNAPVSRRAQLVEGLLAGKVNPITTRLAIFALAGFGGRQLDHALIKLVELAAEHRDQHVAYVTSATPLTPHQEDRLAAYLSRAYARPVSIKADVEPALLGGVTIRINDDLYDGSIAHRLTQARTTLT